MFLSFCNNLLGLNNKKNTVVISLTEHIGDIVAAEPVSGFLKEKHKDRSLTWIVNRKYEELVQTNPAIDHTVTVTCFTEWILLKKFFTFKNLYDLHLDSKVCDKHHLLYHKKPSIDINIKNYYHKGNLLYCFTRSGGMEMDTTVAPHLYLQINNFCSSPFIVLHTTSNHFKRNWTKEAWNQLANHIINLYRGIKIIEVGHRSLIDPNLPGYINCCGKKQLTEIAAAIKNCDLFIGIDSGFAHFANAYERESLILIGAYNGFKNYMPYSGKFQRESQSQIFYTSKELSQLTFEELKPVLENKLRSISKVLSAK